MKPNPPALAAAERADLRLRAEAQWQREHSAGAAAPAATDDPTLVHALQVHAIELEMQNEELRASRAAVEAGLARYTELYDFAPVGYFELDRQGVIGRLNLAAATLLGTERARLIGERLGGCVEEGDRPAFADFLFRVWASAAPQIREVRIPLAGQSLRTIELRATRDDDGLNCLVVAVDITARRQTEQALRESEQRWRLALDGVGDGLWDLDVPSGQVYFSRRWKEMLGFAENEVGTDLTEWSSRVHPEDADRVMADLQAHLEGRTAHYTNEHRLRCKDGSYKWVLDRGTVFSRDAQGRPLRVLGTHTDITPGKATQESLRLLALVLDQIQDHVTVTDLDGIVTYVNQAQKQALQFDLTGLPVTRFNEGLATDAPQRRIAEATLKAGRWQGTVVNRRLNGSEFLVDLRTTLVRNQDGRPVAMVGVGTDVTASKAAEQALRDSETRFRSYFNLPLIGIAITAADKGWIEVNPRLCEIYGYSRRELESLTWADITHPDDLAGNLAEYEKVLAGQSEGYSVDKRFIRKDGKVVHCALSTRCVRRDDGTPGYFVTVVQDITERSQAEQALRASELRFRQMLQTIPEVAVQGYSEDGITCYWNQASERLYGYTAAEAIGRSLLELIIPPEMREVVQDSMRQMLTTGRPIPTAELSLMRKDGSRADVLSSHALVQVPGQAPEMFCVDVDLRERKRVEQELAQHRNHLEALVEERTAALSVAKVTAETANRAKSAFLANMSHEIRTPMNGILGMVHVLRREGVTPQQARRLDTIHNAGRHLLSVIDDILDISRIEAGKLVLEDAPLLIEAIAENARAMLHDRAQTKGLELAVEVWPMPPGLRGDATRIQQALINYASNAIKFSEAGTVTLRVRCVEEDAAGALLHFEVQDKGIGIDAATQARLFANFEQADNSTSRRYGGSGLGLAITRHLATLMGGSAGFDSSLGVGSRFWFTARLRKAPVAAAAPDAMAPMESAEQALRRLFSGRHVLLVEDEPVNREVAQMLLEEAGLKVDTAEDGQKAVDLAARTDYALILMDMQLPQLDGMAATQRIRATGQRVPIVAMTANAFAEDRQRCLAAGMDDYVCKPYVAEELFATILKWLVRQGR
jgi:two-component system sensor histidine kinase/response regulator